MSSGSQQSGFSGSVPGPIDRTSFFDEQQRNRRATWRLSFFCWPDCHGDGPDHQRDRHPGVDVRIGDPVGHRQHLFADLPDLIVHPRQLRSAARQPGGGYSAPVRFASGLFALFVPGMIFTYLLWRWLHRIFIRYGVGGVLFSLAPRSALGRFGRAAIGQHSCRRWRSPAGSRRRA